MVRNSRQDNGRGVRKEPRWRGPYSTVRINQGGAFIYERKRRHYLFRRQQRLTILKAAVHATVHTVQAFVESQKPFYSKAYRNLLQGVKSLLKIFTNPFSSFCPRLTQYDARNPRKRPSSSVRQYVTTYLRHPHPHCHLFNGYYSPVGGCDRHRNSGGGMSLFGRVSEAQKRYRY
ncbi:hypothetical protein CNBG_10119 [Cryptococcus deuterogattii R265]|uniref:uncharacterized protein n=1 Tax=Cryptococcus deuterogattii (strain R265) TaxID=294750 RepID=UPI001934DB2F|nr:hypothetical protein CNBG_10119 [Cryptococcus deuterogattii R265]